MSKVKRFTLTLVSLVFACFAVYVALFHYHVYQINNAVREIPKFTTTQVVLCTLESVPFTKITEHDKWWWEEEKVWMDASIEVASSLFTEGVSCTISLKNDTTTGEWVCLNYSAVGALLR
ncbi:hypothetical protein [Gynuella sp.]|uniref:hypothetical protein n=1 Tax=Gynuella sp. TaxID=2969146 RepID=UPI003D12C103